MRIPCRRERNIGVLPKRHELFAAIVPVFPTPELSTRRCDTKIQTASIAHAVCTAFAFCFADFGIGERHCSLDSAISGKYPQAKKTIPPEVPPAECGFHPTSLDGLRQELYCFQQIELLGGILLNCLGSGNGGGRGIRTPGTLTGTTVFKTAGINRSPIPPRLGKPLAPSVYRTLRFTVRRCSCTLVAQSRFQSLHCRQTAWIDGIILV